MTGLALEGGARCAAFTAGVLDVFMERGITFSAASGVSAGGGCLANYRSGQPGRALGVMIPGKKKYTGLKCFVRTKNLIDLDGMFRDGDSGRPFDYDAYLKSGMHTDFVATCCETGLAEYLSDMGSPERLENVMKATCSVPIMCGAVEIDGKHYLDGSISDSVPFRHLLELGCDRVVAVLTRPVGARPTDYVKLKAVLSNLYGAKYPALLARFMSRLKDYRASLRELGRLESQGRALVIRPTIPAPPKFTNDSAKVFNFYAHGRESAEAMIERIGEWCV